MPRLRCRAGLGLGCVWRLVEAHLPRGVSCGSSTVRALARRCGGGVVANAASAAARQECGAAATEAGAAAAGGQGAAGLPRGGAPRLGKLPSEGLGRSAEAGGRVEAESNDASLCALSRRVLPWPRPWPWP